MKVTTILIFAFLMQVSAAGLAQKITLNERNASLESVMDKIRSQTGYEFVFNVKDIDNAKRVNVSFKAKELNEALEELFEDQALSFSVKDRFIVVKPKEKSFIDKLVGIIDNNSRADIEVRSKVVNDKGEPLAGAVVRIKGTSRATITDAKGTFGIKNVPENSILQISFIGYETKEVTAISDLGTIILKTATKDLDQVVVQAYGTTNQRLATGNIATVTAKEIERQPIMNVLQAIQGKVPGLTVTKTSGYASAPFKVELRGRNNIEGLGEPLYIVDGVPFDVGGAFISDPNATSPGLAQTGLRGPAGGHSPLYSLNPADIESVTVFKDADALAIYGSRGANGVILITTKKGKAGKTKLDANVQSGVSMPSRKYKLMNTQQYLEMRREAFKNSNIEPTPGNAYDLLVWDTNRYIDLQEYFWGDPGHYNDIQLALSGGDQKTTFRVGTGYLKSTNIGAANGADQKVSMQLNLNHKNLNEKFNISLTAFYSGTKTDIINKGNGILRPPNMPEIFDLHGKLNYAGWEPIRNEFPFAGLHQPYESREQALNSNLKIQYNIAKGLNFSTSGGYSITRFGNKRYVPIVSIDPILNPRGTSEFSSNYIARAIIEPQLDYKLPLGKGTVTALIGGTFQSTKLENIYHQGTGYTNDNLLGSIASAPIKTVVDGYSTYNYTAVFGRLNYNYQDKYLFNLGFRRDGSSKFGPGKRFGNFGSAALAWIFTEEKWLKNHSSFLSFGKLRASYGITGSDMIGTYGYLSTWMFTGNSSYQPGTASYISMRHFNSNLQWQSNRKLEIAVNLGFWKDRLSLETVWYRNRSGNQLLQMNIANATGFPSVTANFPAEVENSGLETMLNAKMIDKDNWKWSLNFNLGLNKNKLRAFPGLKESSYADLIIGKPLSINYLLHFTGVDPETGKYTYQDINGDGKITNTNPSTPSGIESDRRPVNIGIKYDGGFGTAISYKNINVNLDFQFRRVLQQNSRFLTSKAAEQISNAPASALNRWQKPGDIKEYARYTVAPEESDEMFINSDGAYTDTRFLRLNNFSLAYNIGSNILKHVKLRSAQIFARGQNMFVISNLEELDPERPTFGAMPPPRTFTLGLQINL